jgi:non-heme chloroperoxidase
VQSLAWLSSKNESERKERTLKGPEMCNFTTRDGAKIYYKDWGTGRAVAFSHGWPQSSDAFEDQVFFLAQRGFRCIAHDRRGHRRSSQPWDGNDMDHYADDLVELLAQLDLTDVVLVGVGAVTPVMLKSAKNPGGMPIEAFDQLRAGVHADWSQLWKDLSIPFCRYNRPGTKISDGVRKTFWLQGMMAGMPASCFCINDGAQDGWQSNSKSAG